MPDLTSVPAPVAETCAIVLSALIMRTVTVCTRIGEDDLTGNADGLIAALGDGHRVRIWRKRQKREATDASVVAGGGLRRTCDRHFRARDRSASIGIDYATGETARRACQCPCSLASECDEQYQSGNDMPE